MWPGFCWRYGWKGFGWRYGWRHGWWGYPYPATPTPEQEIEVLEAYKREVEEGLREIDVRIKELRDLLAKKQSG